MNIYQYTTVYIQALCSYIHLYSTRICIKSAHISTAVLLHALYYTRVTYILKFKQ